MITRRDRIAVGIFVVATAGLLATFLLVLWGLKASQRSKRYYVYTDSSVAGLSPSSAVKYLGVDAGRVEKMEFDDSNPPKVKLTLALAESAPVKSDTKAQLTPQGITGIQFIELVRGKSDRDLPPESEIQFQQSKLTDILAKLDRVSGSLDLFLGDNRERLTAAIEHADELVTTSTRSVAALTSKAGGVIDENRAAIHELIDKARLAMDDTSRVMAEVHDRRTVEEVSKAVSDARTAIQDIDVAVKDLRGELATARIGEAVADVRSTLAMTNALLARSGGRVEDDLEQTGRLLDELKHTVTTIKQLAHEVSERPALLLRDLERPRRDVKDR